jgi:hypothetical protein
MKNNANVKITRDLKAPEGVGVHYRLLCMTGKNKGISYYLKGKRAVVGRSENADVHLDDVKSSREHAELTYINNSYMVTDLGSQNGIIVNDLKINQHRLEDGDKIIIGSTVLKFNILKIENNLSLVSEDDDDDDDELDEEEESPKSISGKKKKKTTASKDKKSNNRLLIYGVLIIIVVIVFLPQDETSQQPKDETSTINRVNQGAVFEAGVTSMQEGDREQDKKLNAVLHRGLREFREGNYFRAMEEFKFALVMSPNHGRATFYLNRTLQRLDEEIELNFFKARQEADALRYEAAIVSYCSILRLISDFEQDQRYQQAKTEIEDLSKRMGLEASENNCSTGE